MQFVCYLGNFFYFSFKRNLKIEKMRKFFKKTKIFDKNIFQMENRMKSTKDTKKKRIFYVNSK